MAHFLEGVLLMYCITYRQQINSTDNAARVGKDATNAYIREGGCRFRSVKDYFGLNIYASFIVVCTV